MSTQTSIWTMIATDGVSDKIRDLVDSGYFAEAQDLDFHLKSITEKLKLLVGERGGSVKLSIYDRQVLELPITVAEELPLILAGYRQVFGSLMSVGMGLDLNEAAWAAKKSTFTNDIEMYDPKDESYKDLKKALNIEDEVFNQPGIAQYDVTHPKSPKPDADAANVGKFVGGLNAQQQLEAENSMIQATVQQLMGPANEMQQQMQQQQQQMAEQQAQGNGDGEGPSSLLEAMSGEKKKDKPDSSTKQKKESSKDDNDEDSEDFDDSNDDKSSKDDSDEDSTGDDSTDKIASLLANVQEKMPKLMELHDKNPEAFKKVVALVQKLVASVKSKEKVSKSELANATEDLNKMIKLRYPVGSVRNRKKKVIVNGKASWRSIASGQVKDTKGNAISVAAHNEKTDDGTEGLGK
jgi:hypothetical protein